jgi:hypothetical protein
MPQPACRLALVALLAQPADLQLFGCPLALVAVRLLQEQGPVTELAVPASAVWEQVSEPEAQA